MKPHRRYETNLWSQGYRYVAGVDEVGRGAWAGPIVAAAVILPPDFDRQECCDSKVLDRTTREKMFVHITRQAISWSVAVLPHSIIDQRGLGFANRRVLELAVERLHVQPQAVLVDALPIKMGLMPVKSIINGDAKVLSIAAASIVAKVARDELMRVEHRNYPEYKFHENKGYGTKWHQRMLKKYGLCDIHRLSFQPMREMTTSTPT